MITKIQWNGHKTLGNLELDFTNSNKNPCSTVIIAGENGTGKTNILQTLFDFLNLGSFSPFNLIEYEADGGIFKITPIHNSDLGFHNREDININEVVTIRTNGNSNKQLIDQDLKDLRHYGCIYSTARSVFKTGPITNTSTFSLNSEPRKTDDDFDFKKIKQLLVDLETEDALEIAYKFNNAKGDLKEDFEIIKEGGRINRFKKAFDSFFEDVRYDTIENVNNNKEIFFMKNGKRISIDELSTGEKQIVYRGAFCLKDRDSISNGIALIDEPELSMHPRWQSKILKFYQDIFSDNGSQRTQIIIATHSQYVVKDALLDPINNKVIVLGMENGILISKNAKTTMLGKLLSSEINYIAFGIISEDYFLGLYNILQGKSTPDSILGCDQYIMSKRPPQNMIKKDSYQNVNYSTLPTYIRNAIAHPNSQRKYSEIELNESIEFMRSII